MMLIFTYIAVLIFTVAFIYRSLSISRMPVHLRWELSPVPHEAGKAHYGGSYLEEFEWWTKPRAKSHLREALYMFQEIVLLKGVREHNPSMWVFSFPFHFGLYLLVGMIGCLILASFGLSLFGTTGLYLGGLGYVLGSIGTLGLLAKRALDPKLRPFNSMSSYFNLLLLATLFLTGCVAVYSGGFLPEMTSFIKAFLTADMRVELGSSLSTHIIVAMVFLIYLPFTYMMHFVAKYFTYHQVRWNDEPMDGNTAMQEEVKKLLSQPVTWSAPHLGADGKKNWVDIATASVNEDDRNA